MKGERTICQNVGRDEQPTKKREKKAENKEVKINHIYMKRRKNRTKLLLIFEIKIVFVD